MQSIQNLTPSQTHSRKNELPDSFQNPDLRKYTEQLISCANTVVRANSTIWGGSEIQFPQSSDASQPLDGARAIRIEDWIPQLAITEDEPLQTGDDRDISAMSETLVRQTESNAEEIESSDSDSDEHYDVVQKCFNKAEGEFSLNQYAAAADFFQAGLKRAERLSLKHKRALELRNVQLKMALSLLYLGNLVESGQRFLSLASPQTTDDKSVRLALHASSGMAQMCL